MGLFTQVQIGGPADMPLDVENEADPAKSNSQRYSIEFYNGMNRDLDDDEQDTKDEVLNTGMSGHWVFNGIIGAFICLNTIYLGVEVDLGDDLGAAGVIIGIFFACVWLFEMAIRIYFAQSFKEYVIHNKLDFLLVWISMVDSVLLPFLTWVTGGEGVAEGLQITSSLRILRLLKILRVIRFMTFFRELWLLVKGMFVALPVLAWVVLLIILELYVASLVMTNIIGSECKDSGSFEDWPSCDKYFGSLGASMVTLFQIMTLDSWAEPIARPILKEKPFVSVFFLAFLYCSTFGTMNLVIGILVEHIIKASQEDEVNKMKAKEKASRKELLLLRSILQHADGEDQNGHITLTDFTEACKRKDVQEHFSALDLPVFRPRLARRIFEVLDSDGDGAMTVDQFLNRASCLKQEGKHLQTDLTLLLMDVRHLSRKMDRCFPDPAIYEKDKEQHGTLGQGFRDGSEWTFQDIGKSASKTEVHTGKFDESIAALEDKIAKLLQDGLFQVEDRCGCIETRIKTLADSIISARFIPTIPDDGVRNAVADFGIKKQNTGKSAQRPMPPMGSVCCVTEKGNNQIIQPGPR